MKIFWKHFHFLFLITFIFAGRQWEVNESTDEKLVISIHFDVKTESDLEPLTFLIGLPDKELPTLSIRELNKQKNPFFIEGKHPAVRWINQQKVRSLETATLEINPANSDNYYYENYWIEISFFPSHNRLVTANKTQTLFLQNRILNWDSAKNWFYDQKHSRKKKSELPLGKWMKFSVKEDKLYSFSGADLISLSGTVQNENPRSFMLFTSTALGRDRSSTVINTISYSEIPENLVEISMFVTGEDNEKLDNDDLFQFYGRGANGFDQNGETIKHHQNLYFTDNHYWLLIPDDSNIRGKRIKTAASPSTTSLSLDYATSYIHIENDVINPFLGGLIWTGSGFGRGSSFTVVPKINDPEPSVSAEIKVSIRGSFTDLDYVMNTSGISKNHTIFVYLNERGIAKDTITFSGANQRSGKFSVNGFDLKEGVNLIYLDNKSTSSSYSFPHFDYATIRYGRKLNIDNSPFEFFAPITGNSVSFNFSGTLAPNVWDITDVTQPKMVDIAFNNSNYSMNVDLPSDTLMRFILFKDTDVSPITNMDLISGHSFTQLRHNNAGVDHLIIGPGKYESASQPLADHRGSSKFIPLETIYDEFSGGNADPTAIRRFLQWTNEQWSNPIPYSVLFMGDADYDYRNISGESGIKVPTIIKGAYGNRAVDDRLAAFSGRIPDLAIGRFPAKNVDEVQDYVEKIIEYETHPVLGYWRQRVTLVADDGARPEDDGPHGSISTGKSHTLNSENASKFISPRIEVQKLYMLEYPEVSDASSYGVIKPDATEALFDILTEGTAIINYIGHGSEHQWAQEKLLVQDRGDIGQIETNMKLPVWIAGTCSWGHFDFLDKESFAEELIRQPMEGASSIITTSRPIAVSSNAAYIVKLFKAIFPDLSVTDAPIGVVLQSVKDGNSSGELFHLFGDPSMPLPIPEKEINMTHIVPDTLSSLDTARVFGRLTSPTGASGVGVIRLADADRDVTRQYIINSKTQEISYTLPGPILFKGQFSITENNFSARLRIPKDISYSTTPAHLNSYVQLNSEPPTEALGILNNIFLKSGKPISDTQGPIISLETETGRLLQDNDHLQKDEKIIIRISDPIGINLTGEVGHEIIVSNLNDDMKKNMSSQYIYDENSITTGVIQFPHDGTDSPLSLHIKAWDNANNPSEKEFTLYLFENQTLNIFNVLNFPNPYSTTTQFAFELTSDANVSIDIFTLGGRRIMSIPEEQFSEGYHYINWNGRDAYGERLANGVYLYRLKANDGNQTVSVIKKLAKFQ
ncbi:MAG: type IX secretion system sortase PorU [Fidelibacterota bacterium]